MEKNIEISLNFNRKDFEEIYFKDNQGSYTKDLSIKNLYRYLILSIIASIIFLIYSSSTKQLGPLIMSIVFVIVFGFRYFDKYIILKKWKKVVIDYMDKEEKYSSHKLILSNNYLSIVQDENETIEKWNNFKSVKILEDYIFLEGKENILFPLKSMTKEEFITLKKVISEKVK